MHDGGLTISAHCVHSKEEYLNTSCFVPYYCDYAIYNGYQFHIFITERVFLLNQ